MQRETRANLIFLVALVLLMAPGVTITLLRHPNRVRGLSNPTPVRGALAYMDRTAGSARYMPRVVPPQLGGHVAEVARSVARMQRGLTSTVGDGRFAPVMSDDLYLQEIAEGAAGGRFRVALIAWAGDLLPLPKLYKFEGTRGAQTLPADLESYEQQNMPIELRAELQSYGYILPPDGYIWLIVAFDGESPVDSIHMTYVEGKTRLDDTIALRPPPANDPAVAPASRPASQP